VAKLSADCQALRALVGLVLWLCQLLQRVS